MIEWKPLYMAYEPPGTLQAPPVPPRAAFQAVAPDGARLEAYRWGSPLGQPFMLEVRRYGVPLGNGYEHMREDADAVGFTGALPWPLGDAELPHLGEIQAAVDQLLPVGVMVLLVMASSGPDATYLPAKFYCVRVAQPATPPRSGGGQA